MNNYTDAARVARDGLTKLIKHLENPIVTYSAKTFKPESILMGNGRDYEFYVLAGDDGTWAWGPREDAWFQCGFPSREAAIENAEDYYMTIGGE